MTEALFESTLTSLPLLGRGKVRDLYAVDNSRLLIVATDRLSVFDVVLPDPIPGKGRMLTAISNAWFARTAHIVANHLLPQDLQDLPLNDAERRQIAGRAALVKRVTPLPVEAVVRGYLAGSGWLDYRHSGGIREQRLPAGLQQADRLPEPLFTPASKAPAGEHDENITFADMQTRVGDELAREVRRLSLEIYSFAVHEAARRGIIIADTKFEFGLDADGRLLLIDEVLTPDSSRFWPADEYRPGGSPPSFDKQFVRDYVESLQWNKQPPGPSLPAEIIAATAGKYRQAQQLLIGETPPA